ncbi:RND multidrug efflux transporter [Salinisphaera sp. PC39]|uniref:efflux RND transporter permease subunit n=1 Tax=Salinisphaera sp. PC39 TaxID=1304156 RepID=UPI0033413B88
MHFTDIFIRRPVLATVVSLLILLVGLRAYFDLTVRQYPQSDKAVVTVQTTYVGADAELVKGFITTPLEKEIASADGIDYLESTSAQGVSIISANLELNYDPVEALTQITSKVNKVRSELPEASEDPVIDVQVGETTASMYMSYTSDVMESNEITDYLNRVVVPELSTIAGVEKAEVLGGRRFAMRIWLDPNRLAAYDMTPSEVRARLAENNFLAAIGKTKGDMISVALDANTDLTTEREFRDLVLRESDGTLVRLGDVAEVELGAESYDSSAINSGHRGPFIGITVLPQANELTVIQAVRERFPELQAQFPEGLNGSIVYDATEYIEDAIGEVVFTLGLALAIVTFVIFLFMGSLRSVLVPALAIPLSLIGVGIAMLLFGFSINLLTLLALVLAIGLVCDDAIIVVENIHRHIEDGMKPFDAAIRGARELGTAIIAMSLTLIAVYLPIGFTGGLTGSLFTEFAFTLAGAVFISGIVAITFSPMLCSKVLKPETGDNGGFAHWLDRQFDRLKDFYERRLHNSLDYRPVTYVFAVTVLVSCYFLFTTAEGELAPTEDQSILFVQATAQPNASLPMLEQYTREMTELYKDFPEYKRYFLVNGFGGGGSAASTNRAISGMQLVPWGQRERTQMEIKPELQETLRQVAGVDTAVFERPPLPGSGGGLPVQFVVGATAEPDRMREAVDEVAARAQQSGLFVYTDLDLKFDRPQVEVQIDREAVADLGLTMRDVGGELATMLGGNFVNRFSIQGRAYEVTPQVRRGDRLNPEQLQDYYLRSADGGMVPMSAVVHLEKTVEPRNLKRFQQLNAATLAAVPAPGVTMGEALDFLERTAAEVLPQDYKTDYAGQSRQFVQEGNTLVITFFFAVIIIFLVLAAQFESFRDPVIMLVTVPMSVAGALLFITLGFTTVNIYTQVGLITLIGLISKHGILIVEFANQLQRDQGLAKRAAIEEAAALRLRPILMTTASTVFGVVPLILASGAGASARFSMGLVIVAGMSIGTLFTLFVVPAIYMLLASDDSAETAEVQA